MKATKIAAAFGNGLLATATVIHNAPIKSRMDEIDVQIKELQEEKARLQKQLVK